jgi:hypothetical protein
MRGGSLFVRGSRSVAISTGIRSRSDGSTTVASSAASSAR